MPPAGAWPSPGTVGRCSRTLPAPGACGAPTSTTGSTVRSLILPGRAGTVSYTHLTLPTICSV
eukprot:9597239-Alexandrium_andersonii.AAC.1